MPVYWTVGSHEDRHRLGAQITEIDSGIFYCPFGNTLAISPDVTVFFAGGGESHDIESRLRWMADGALKCWWKQEGVSDDDSSRLASVPKADWVISHSAPASFDFKDKLPSVGNLNEPSRDKLEQVMLKYAPLRWFFGHFHKRMTGQAWICAWIRATIVMQFSCGKIRWQEVDDVLLPQITVTNSDE